MIPFFVHEWEAAHVKDLRKLSAHEITIFTAAVHARAAMAEAAGTDQDPGDTTNVVRFLTGSR